MAITGYDETQVVAAIASINTSYDSLINALITKNQQEFVSKMGSIWGCEQAKNFFAAYKTDIDELASKITTTYESVVNAMNGAAQTLSNMAGSTWSTKTFSSRSDTLDTSVILDNIGGVKGIDIEEAESTLEVLDSIASSVESALEIATTAVTTSGFVGRNMQEQLEGSLSKIKDAISSKFSEEKVAVSNAIKETVDMYSTGTSNISSNFAG